MKVVSISSCTDIVARTFLLVFLALATLVFFTGNKALAHTPDRCFHTHGGIGNTQTCKRNVINKTCNDGKGNKGRCRQQGRYCICKKFKKSGSKKPLGFSIGIGVGFGLGSRPRHPRRPIRHLPLER